MVALLLRRLALVCFALQAGCFSPRPRSGLSCSPTERCPPEQTCVDGVCFTEVPAPPADGACNSSCGDVVKDGIVDKADKGRIEAAVGGVRLDDCAANAADIDGDGVLTARDVAFADQLIEGTASGGCTMCEAACGDVDVSGVIDVSDGAQMIGIANGDQVADVCVLINADVNRSGTVDVRDVHLLQAAIAGRIAVGPVCEVCSGMCGDASQDGVVSVGDAVTITGTIGLGSTVTPTFCEFDAADVNSDLQVNQRDAHLIRDFALGSYSIGCVPCTRICGDVNQNGMVTAADATLATAWANGIFTVPQTACGVDAADIDGDGEVSADDAQAILDASIIPAIPVCEGLN